MSWNYRVIKKKDEQGHDWYEVHEVYYDDAGQAEAATERSHGPCGESMETVRRELAMMARALEEPVLAYDERACRFVEQGKD